MVDDDLVSCPREGNRRRALRVTGGNTSVGSDRNTVRASYRAPAGVCPSRKAYHAAAEVEGRAGAPPRRGSSESALCITIILILFSSLPPIKEF